MPTIKTKRIDAFDLLRGFFIVVIIIDHLGKFPSLWMFITGKALLWMTAAEGFIMISGFMIGYIRGFKSLKKPFQDIAWTLTKRAGILYLWMVIMSIVYTALVWHSPYDVFIIGAPHQYDGGEKALLDIFTMKEPAVWIHFLKLYAVFLLGAIGFVWLLRQGRAAVAFALTSFLYICGLVIDSELLKWQYLFFLTAFAGFYLETIRDYWHNRHTVARWALYGLLYGASITTLYLSIVSVYFSSLLPTWFTTWADSTFAIQQFGLGRLLISVLWFGALLLLFVKIAPWLQKITGRQLQYIGTHSLTAYIVHGLVIYAINLQIWPENQFWLNTSIGALTVLGVWAVIKLPLVRAIIPK